VHDAALRIAVLSFDENPESAREVLRSVQDSGVKQAHSAFLLEAELDSGARNFDAAIRTLARGLSFFPDDPGLLYARALAFANVNETALAESDLRLLLERDPENAATLNALGYTLLTQSDRLEEAGKLIRRAFALEPKDPAILDSIGWLLFKQGDAAKALPYLEKAFAESKDPEVIAHLGEVLLVLGETERALSLWRDSLAAHGSHPIFKEAIERLAPGLSSS
jgi:Flp pilus assembly protein TadD